MKVAVLLSGGVDSSVALCRLLEGGGVEVRAFYLKIWLADELSFLGQCPWEEDLGFARAVCERLGVPLEVVPFQRVYEERVVSYTLTELRAGRTPSSDVLCNQQVKFGAFLDSLGQERQEVDGVASGHYARVEKRDGLAHLLCSPDPVKDQTYFLSRLSQEQLSRCVFPLGPFTKAEVRELASRYDLPNQARPDSQGICFLGQIPFQEFIRHHLGERPGEIVEAETQRLLGEHKGYWFHTIGQRKGLGLSGGPWYVVGKDVEANRLYVSHREDLAGRSRDGFEVADLHWIAEPPAREELEVKLRHGPSRLPCRLSGHEVRLAQPDAGVAAGQFAVFYDGDVCLGSGVIHESSLRLS